MKKALLIVVATLSFGYANAQMKLGTNPTTTNSNALLEMETTNKGLLLPRVALTSTISFAPLTAHVAGMAVYNTATAGDVTPGYYFDNGTKWVKLSDASALQLTTGAAAGKVLTSDAAGNATWQTPSGGAAGWALTGNTATTGTAGTNFIGTTDAQDVVFKTSGTERARVLSVPNAAKEIMTLTGGDANINGVTVGQGLGSGNTNTAVGNSANTGLAANASVFNTSVGYQAFQTSLGSSNTAVGYQALQKVNLTLNNAASNNTAIGKNAMTGGASGTDANFGNTGIGSTALEAITDAQYNTATGYQALNALTTGDNNVAYGHQAGNTLTTGSGNIVIGKNAQVPTAIADNQLCIGNTLYGTGVGTATAKIGIGTASPAGLLDVRSNIASTLARSVFKNDGATSRQDVQIGATGAGDLYVGVDASGSLFGAGVKAYLDNRTTGRLVLGSGGIEQLTILADGKVGISTNAPAAKLDVAGTVKITDGTQGAGKILTSDAAGLASWTATKDIAGVVTKLIVSPNSGATGGNIPCTTGYDIIRYESADGNYAATITLPVGCTNGQRIQISSASTFTATIAKTNTNALGTTMLKTGDYYEFVFNNGKWSPSFVPTRRATFCSTNTIQAPTTPLSIVDFYDGCWNSPVTMPVGTVGDEYIIWDTATYNVVINPLGGQPNITLVTGNFAKLIYTTGGWVRVF
jgi:hypothetical protein